MRPPESLHPRVTVRELLADVEARLRAAGVPTPDVDARWLVRHVTGWSGSDLLVRSEDAVPARAGQQLAALAARRAAREPLQLVLGTIGFRHLDLEVRPGVFIPRPETEVLAGEAVNVTPAGGVVVEPCTGTGAVACAVATEAAPRLVVATDSSPAAVDLARRNAARCGATVTVLAGDLLAPVDPALRGRVDVLVSNPPYVAEAEVAGLEPEVRDWDPRDALVAGPTGHEVSDLLIAGAAAWLTPRGWLLLEVAATRATETAGRAVEAGLDGVRVVADLAGRDRVVVARAPARRRG